MLDEQQKQTSGDNSINALAGRDAIIQPGLSLNQVKELLDRGEHQYARGVLAGLETALAVERRGVFSGVLSRRLAAAGPEPFSKLGEPAFCRDAAEGEAAFARSGSGEMMDLLLDLLVERARCEELSLPQVILSETQRVVPRLTPVQYDALTLLLLKHVTFRADDIDSLARELADFLIPCKVGIPVRGVLSQHLVYSGVVSESVASTTVCGVINSRHTRALTGPISPETLAFNNLSESELAPVLSPHPSGCRRFLINGWSDCESQLRLNGLTEEKIVAARTLYSATLLSDTEVQSALAKLRPDLGELIKALDESHWGYLNLTSVGVVIGAVNARRRSGKIMNLSPWIGK